MLIRKLISSIIIFLFLTQCAFASGDLAAGEFLYRKKCANCHGITGQGNGPDAIKYNFNPKPINFVNDSKNIPPGRLGRKSDRELAISIRDGMPNTAMSSFKTLSDQEIKDLVLYIRSLSKEKTLHF